MSSFNGLRNQVGIVRDSKKCSSADSENMRGKFAKIYSRQRAALKMFSPVDFSKISKFTSLG
jgi:hypothetical protein